MKFITGFFDALWLIHLIILGFSLIFVQILTDTAHC